MTTNRQINPVVAARDDGSFIVVWESAAIDSGDLVHRIFDSTGAPLGSETQVNVQTLGEQAFREQAITVLPDGRPGDDNDGTSLQARRFQSDGTTIGDQFQVNTFTSDDADTPRVAARDGDYVVTWRSYESPGNDTNESSTQARRFGSDGAASGEQFQVNSFTPGNNDDANPAIDRAGGFFIAWESEPVQQPEPFQSEDPAHTKALGSPDGSGNAVRARRFLIDGTPVGDDLTVNDFTAGNQDDPVVAILGPERAVVVFESAGSPGSDDSSDSIQTRIFDLCPGPNDGADVDGDQIPDDCDACQGDNQTGDSDADGVCDDLDLCLGDDATGGGDMDGLCADRDCNDADPSNACAIFADNFETGDTSRWSFTG